VGHGRRRQDNAHGHVSSNTCRYQRFNISILDKFVHVVQHKKCFKITTRNDTGTYLISVPAC
jgi:hypothetical protein